MTSAEWSDGAFGPLLSLYEEITEEPRAWQDDALCAQSDPESWFPEKGGSTAQAKAICRACPVREPCLEYALEHAETWGIWGGLSKCERRRLRRAPEAAA